MTKCKYLLYASDKHMELIILFPCVFQIIKNVKERFQWNLEREEFCTNMVILIFAVPSFTEY